MRCKIEHFVGHFFVRNLVEIRVFFSHFVWVPQRNAEQPLAPRFKCDDVFARREDYFCESNDPLLTNRFANNREGLLPYFPVWDNVIRISDIQFINVLLRNELVNLDCGFALDRPPRLKASSSTKPYTVSLMIRQP
jgi:hypothetical protein